MHLEIDIKSLNVDLYSLSSYFLSRRLQRFFLDIGRHSPEIAPPYVEKVLSNSVECY